ncbi:pyruvate ferredoxin oxidoreductase [Rothia mucilaginosa]|uniref:pyruvate ferredoxin oxidoreductase n=1 Tax=Rothia mucilaginosa TaxID=43675 RepID=UPI0034D675B0
MADRPAAQKEEAYQPLWDTDQSIPEYMTLLMGEETQKNEDAEPHENSENSNEPEDTSEDTHENEVENRPVALASTQSAGSAQPVLSASERAQAMQAQAMQTQTTYAYGEYVRLESLGLSPGAILPVIPDPLFGTPDSKLIEMRLLDRSQDEPAPMQACAAHLNPVKAEENSISRAAMLQPVGYVPVNRPPTRYSVKDLKKELTLSNIGLAALLIVNPFVLAPLASIVDPEYGFIIAFIFVVIGVGSLFVVPVLWIMGIVRTFKRRNQINDLIEEGQTPPTEFWYYLVYNRLPEGYTGVNGYTKEEEDSFSVYEFLKKQEHAKLHEAVAPREAAAHPALADEEKQD